VHSEAWPGKANWDYDAASSDREAFGKARRREELPGFFQPWNLGFG